MLRSEHVDVLLRGVDMLAQVAQRSEAEVEAWQTERADEIDALVAELKTAKDDRLPHRAGPLPSSTPAPEAMPVAVPSPVTDESQTDPHRRHQPTAEEIFAPAAIPAMPSAVSTEESRVDTPASQSSGTDRDRDRVVRVTAESLTRLLGLAGEALVQSHRLPPLVESLWRLKGKQTGLLESVQILEDRVSNREDAFPPPIASGWPR